jgi:pheromone shutdown protein TraB
LIFLFAFLKGININTSIFEYILLTGSLAFAGSILSGSKIYSAITAFLAAPITVLHPLLAAGWFAGIIEAKLRNVGMDDISDFKECQSFKDFWNNNLFRVLIVVAGANIGATIGAILTIPNILYPLFSKLLGWG